MPACDCRNPSGLRFMVGRSCICVLVMVVETSELVVCTVVAASLTSTDSVVPAMASFSVCTSVTRLGSTTNLLTTSFEKPFNSTTMSYVLGGTDAISNAPLALVFVVNRLLPLPVNCRLTAAPGTAAPGGSTTVPVTLLATWAVKDVAASKTAANSNTKRKRITKPLSFGSAK